MPVAIIVFVSASRKTELVAIAKMLASSCVTIAMVAPRLSRGSRMRSSSSFELIGSSALAHAAADLRRVELLEAGQADQRQLE